jgi:hypothetical protein
MAYAHVPSHDYTRTFYYSLLILYFIGTWKIPWSITRLIEKASTWDFDSEARDVADCGDGEPRLVRACRRIRERLLIWRDAHGPTDNPWYDARQELFHVADVALLHSEVVRLWRLEERVIDALGPPAKRLNKRTGEWEEH